MGIDIPYIITTPISQNKKAQKKIHVPVCQLVSMASTKWTQRRDNTMSCTVASKRVADGRLARISPLGTHQVSTAAADRRGIMPSAFKCPM